MYMCVRACHPQLFHLKPKPTQVVTIPAPLDALPCFVKSGTIVPTLDPSVGTLFYPPEKKKEGGGREEGGPVTYAERAHILHLWAWADARGRCVVFFFKMMKDK